MSVMGADAKSGVFYNRTKGEMEDAVAALGFPALVLARPSLLAGDRDALRQPERKGEKLALWAMKLDFLIPANYKAIGADKVARALLRAVKEGVPGRRVLLSGEMLAAG